MPTNVTAAYELVPSASPCRSTEAWTGSPYLWFCLSCTVPYLRGGAGGIKSLPLPRCNIKLWSPSCFQILEGLPHIAKVELRYQTAYLPLQTHYARRIV
jgi:hypothetical protein